MVIHDPEEQPLIDEFGIAINPATYTLAAITEVSIQNKNKSNSSLWLVFFYDYGTFIIQINIVLTFYSN